VLSPAASGEKCISASTDEVKNELPGHGPEMIDPSQPMMVTSFWHPDGTPMSAQQFLFVLSHYVTAGVKELDQEKLTPWRIPENRKGSDRSSLDARSICIRSRERLSLDWCE